MASLSTCHLGLWLGWQILLNLVKSTSVDNLKRFHIYLATEAPRVISGTVCSNYNVINSNSDCNTLSTETALPNELLKVSDSHKGVVRLQLNRSEAFDIDRHKHAAYTLL